MELFNSHFVSYRINLRKLIGYFDANTKKCSENEIQFVFWIIQLSNEI